MDDVLKGVLSSEKWSGNRGRGGCTRQNKRRGKGGSTDRKRNAKWNERGEFNDRLRHSDLKFH